MANRQGRGKSTAAAARRSRQNNHSHSLNNKKKNVNVTEEEYDDEEDEFWDELFMWLLKLLTVLSVALTTLLIYQSYMLGTVHYQGLSTTTTGATAGLISNGGPLSHNLIDPNHHHHHHHFGNDNDDWNIYLVEDRPSLTKSNHNDILAKKEADGSFTFSRPSVNTIPNDRHYPSPKMTNSFDSNSQNENHNHHNLHNLAGKTPPTLISTTNSADPLFDTTLNPLKTTVTTQVNNRYIDNDADLLRPNLNRKAGYSYKYYYYDEVEQTFSSLYTNVQENKSNHLYNDNNNNNGVSENSQYDLYNSQQHSMENNHHNHHPKQGPLPPKAQPSICRDNVNYGYSDYGSLKMAIDELNSRYESSMGQWFEYQAAMTEYELILFLHFSSNQPEGEIKVKKPPIPPLLPNELPMPDPIQICPGAVIQGRYNRASSFYQQTYQNPSTPSSSSPHPIPISGYNPMFTINAPHIWIQCENCSMESTSTHISFGQYARDVLIRGLSFSGATTGSLIFHSHGADVNFEDCSWTENTALGKTGAVADVNSTR